MNQGQRENTGYSVILDETSEDVEIAQVLRAHGKNPFAEEEATREDSSHGD